MSRADTGSVVEGNTREQTYEVGAYAFKRLKGIGNSGICMIGSVQSEVVETEEIDPKRTRLGQPRYASSLWSSFWSGQMSACILTDCSPGPFLMTHTIASCCCPWWILLIILMMEFRTAGQTESPNNSFRTQVQKEPPKRHIPQHSLTLNPDVKLISLIFCLSIIVHSTQHCSLRSRRFDCVK